MPYKIEHKNDKWQVVEEDTGKAVGEPHDTKEEAKAHMKALYANVDDAQKSYKIIRRKTGGKIVFDLTNGNNILAKACSTREEAESVHKQLTKNDMAQFVSFSKVDDEKRMVYGTATDETPDVDDEIVDWGATQKAAADYSQWRNVREMHDAKAVGTADTIELDNINKKMLVGVHVSDDDAWKKIKDKVYKGFSIGGKKKAVEVFKDAGRTLTRITDYILTEISLVDRPANPSAVFSIVKRNDIMDKIDEEMDDKKQDAAPVADGKAPPDNGDAVTAEQGEEPVDVTEEEQESEDAGNSDAQQDIALIEAVVLKMLIKYGLIKPADDGKDEMELSTKVSNLQKSMDGLARKSDLGQFAKAGSLGDFAKVSDLHKLAGDIAKTVEAVNGVDERVTLIEKTPRGVGPVLREIGQTGSVPADFQTEAALSALIEKCDNPMLKEELSKQLATMQIKKIQTAK